MRDYEPIPADLERLGSDHARSCIVFRRSVENVELLLSRAWTHVLLRAPEARCDNTCQKKPERGVSEIARDMKKIFTSR